MTHGEFIRLLEDWQYIIYGFGVVGLTIFYWLWRTHD